MQRWQRQEQQNHHANNSEFVLNQPSVSALSGGESYSFHGPGPSARANLPLPTMFSVRIILSFFVCFGELIAFGLELEPPAVPKVARKIAKFLNPKSQFFGTNCKEISTFQQK